MKCVFSIILSYPSEWGRTRKAPGLPPVVQVGVSGRTLEPRLSRHGRPAARMASIADLQVAQQMARNSRWGEGSMWLLMKGSHQGLTGEPLARSTIRSAAREAQVVLSLSLSLGLGLSFGLGLGRSLGLAASAAASALALASTSASASASASALASTTASGTRWTQQPVRRSRRASRPPPPCPRAKTSSRASTRTAASTGRRAPSRTSGACSATRTPSSLGPSTS